MKKFSISEEAFKHIILFYHHCVLPEVIKLMKKQKYKGIYVICSFVNIMLMKEACKWSLAYNWVSSVGYVGYSGDPVIKISTILKDGGYIAFIALVWCSVEQEEESIIQPCSGRCHFQTWSDTHAFWFWLLFETGRI